MGGGGKDGTGIKKSSTVPMEVPDIKGAEVLEVAMGLAHSLCILRATGKSRPIVDKLPVHDVEELDQREKVTAELEEDEEDEEEEEEEEPVKKKRKKSGEENGSGKKKKKKKAAGGGKGGGKKKKTGGKKKKGKE